MQKIKQRHFLVDFTFALGGAMLSSGIAVLLTTPLFLKGVGILVLGAIIFFGGVVADRRNIKDEEHEIEEAENKAGRPNYLPYLRPKNTGLK